MQAPPQHNDIGPQPIHAKPVRPVSMSAEMPKDYRIFKTKGLLSEWRRKLAAYLPEPD